jgi:hypothetical protein
MRCRECIWRCGLVILSICAFSGNASAADHPNEGLIDAQFKTMDTDGDGRLSPDEHAAGAKRMFDAMDSNKDGTVTIAEMDAAHRNVPGKEPKNSDLSSIEKIKVVDQNGDGLLSADEHAAGSRKMFSKMDADRDGFLSRAELTAGHEKMLKRNEP